MFGMLRVTEVARNVPPTRYFLVGRPFSIEITVIFFSIGYSVTVAAKGTYKLIWVVPKAFSFCQKLLWVLTKALHVA